MSTNKRYGSRVLGFLLAIIMVVSVLPLQIFAAGNNDSLPSNYGSGTGKVDWKYSSRDNEGLRYTIMWAPSIEDFENGTDKVIRIGSTTDISKTGFKYKIERYTRMSAYDYRNNDNQKKESEIVSYNPTLNSKTPYDWIGPNQSSLVAQMPTVYRRTPEEAVNAQQEWREFFDGPYVNGEPTYKNIQELVRLATHNDPNVKITAENYKNGYLPSVGKNGVYKIYAEPLINMIAEGYGTVATFIELIRYEDKLVRENKPKLMDWLTPVFVETGNSMILIEEEKSLDMIANNRTALVYTNPDNQTTKNQQRTLLRSQINRLTGHAYKSMGVGVFTSPISETPINVVKSYVVVAGVNTDGTLRYEEIRPTEVVPAEFESNGALVVETVNDIDAGVMYLNDIIISPIDLTKENVKWTSSLPKGLSKQINPTPAEIEQYRLGDITGTTEYILKALKEGQNEVSINGQLLTELTEFIKVAEDIVAGKTVSKSNYQKAILKAAEFTNLKSINLDKLSSQFKKTMVSMALREAIKEQNKNQSTVTDAVVKSATYISNVNEIYIDKEGNKTVYIRYVVVPTSKEVIFEEIYVNGVKVNSVKTVKNIPLSGGDDGTYETETYFTDLSKEGYELVSWATAKGNLLDKMPTSPIKSGSKYEGIKGLNTDENVYVQWKIENNSGAATGDYVVDEWRLSKYTDNLGYESQAYMGLSLSTDYGHSTSTISPSGAYRYDTVNPNGKITESKSSPENMKFTTYLHSKAITKGNYSITHSKPSTFVDITGNLNLIKSTDLSGLRVASWTVDNNAKSTLKLHNIDVSDKGVVYAGQNIINKTDILKYGIKNKDTYTHNYGVYYHYTCHHDIMVKGKLTCTDDCHDVCACYTSSETQKATYLTADYKVDMTFNRFKSSNTDNKLLKLSKPEIKVENGKTTYIEQSSSILNIYPEVPMLFDDDNGNSSIQFVVGGLARQIQPISFHTLEYKAYVDKVNLSAQGAIDSRAQSTARQIGLGSAPVVYKGSPVIASFEIRDSKGSKDLGYIETRTYTLDVQNGLKSDWNTINDTSKINNDFLSKFGSKKGGKWVFLAKKTSNLYVESTPVFNGNLDISNVNYTEKSNKINEYKLTVRGAVVTQVDGKDITTIKSTNPNLYEALEGMRLVGPNKDATVFSTFEHQKGSLLTEQEFKDKASSIRGVDNLELGKGWYSEDSTVLLVREYVTQLEIPLLAVSTDKIPMSIKGLETPINKQQFFSKIAKGYHNIKLEVGSGNLKTYFEHNTSKESSFGRRMLVYGVPNVSVLDTSVMN